MDLLSKAIQLAAYWHKGQTDKGGAPYILHPIRVNEDRVNVQFPVDLLVLHGHVAVQPQQIKPNNAPHAHPHFRRGHYRDRVTSQLKVAA